MARGLHHIALNTNNFEAMIDFYCRGLGFEMVVPEFCWNRAEWIKKTTGYYSVARQVILKTSNCYMEIFEYSEPAARLGEALKPFDCGFTHIALEVDDIHDEYRRLQGLGMLFVYHEPVRTPGHDDVWAVYGEDPDGNIIEILQVPRENVSLDHLLALPAQ